MLLAYPLLLIQNMRYFVIYIFISFVFCSCIHQKSSFFTIEGVIEGVRDSTEITIYYFIHNNGKFEEISNTTFLKNDKFYFKGNINELTAADLVCSDEEINIPIYLEPTAIKLDIDKNNPYCYKLSGTRVEKENIELRNILAAHMKATDSIKSFVDEIFMQIDLNKNEQILVDSLWKKIYYIKEELINNAKQIDSLKLDFINKHTDYKIIPYLLFILSRNDIISHDTIAAIYNDLLERSKSSLLGKLAYEQIKMAERVTNRKDISIGDTAPDFLRVSMQGDTLRLADFKGKNNILLDFWASWCGPCIKGIPTIKTIHNEIEKEKLLIIGISLDHNKEDWIKAIMSIK